MTIFQINRSIKGRWKRIFFGNNGKIRKKEEEESQKFKKTWKYRIRKWRIFRKNFSIIVQQNSLPSNLNLNDKILIDNDCHGNPFLRVQQRYRSITFPSTENSIERRELFATRAKIVENRGGYFPRYNWFDTIGAIFKRPLTNGTSQWSGLLTRALNGFNIPTSKEELSAIYQYLSNSTAIAAPGVLCKYDKVSDIFFFYLCRLFARSVDRCQSII